MPELQNGGFETEGATPSEADGWALLSATAGGSAVDLESFESGWGNTDLTPPAVSVEFGADLLRESFERLWGPFDGVDTNYPSAVAPGLYSENAGFVTTLALFSVGPDFDSFEDTSWGAVPFFLDWDSMALITAPIEGDFESFESGWSNDTFLTELDDGVTAIAAEFYAVDPQEIESFERNYDGHELVEVLVAAPGVYFIDINGYPRFEYLADGGDTDMTIANGLIGRINDSTLPYAASLFPGGGDPIAVVKNQSNAPMLITVGGPANDGSDITRTSPTINVTAWLMPLDL